MATQPSADRYVPVGITGHEFSIERTARLWDNIQYNRVSVFCSNCSYFIFTRFSYIVKLAKV
jgi:hypothetical protein